MDDHEGAIATLDPAEEDPPRPQAPPPGLRARGAIRPAAQNSWKSPKVITSAVSGLLVFAGWLIHLADGPPWLGEACADAAILSGAFYFGRKALADLVSHHVVGFYFLMSAAA